MCAGCVAVVGLGNGKRPPAKENEQLASRHSVLQTRETVNSYDNWTELESLFNFAFQKRILPLSLVGKSCLFALLRFSTVVLG